MLNIVLFHLILFVGVCTCQTKVENILNRFDPEKTYELRNTIYEIHKIGIDAIPALIAHISDTSTIASVAFINPMSSHLPSLEFPAGIVFAYMVELLLAKDSLAACSDQNFLFCSAEDYIYYSGRIFDESNNRTINCEQLPLIKEEYLTWWEKNKDKPAVELRRMYKNNQKPLTNSLFKWR